MFGNCKLLLKLFLLLITQKNTFLLLLDVAASTEIQPDELSLKHCFCTSNCAVTSFSPSVLLVYLHCGFYEATWKRTHLSRNWRAAGVRHSTALRAGVFMCTIKVEVPGPVSVVGPPTAFELSKGETREGTAQVYI